MINVQQEETAMEYLHLVTTLNPVALAILGIVLLCGAWDHWLQSK